MLFSCTHMATVGVKGLLNVTESMKSACVCVWSRLAARHRRWSYRFRVHGVGAGVHVTSASLWLHKNRDVSSNSSGGFLTLNVHAVCSNAVGDDSAPPRNRRYQLPWTSGWVQLDVTHLLRRPATKLTVSCVGSPASRCRRVMSARSARRRPFLVVGTAAERQPERRRRRHLRRCVDGDCCSLRPYYINFTDLGWNFVQRPEGFSVNYCYGSCRG